MQIVSARTAKEFIRLISPNGRLFSSEFDDYLFRGQADAAWSLVPSALRSGSIIPDGGALYRCPRPTNRDQIDLEHQSMHRFGRTLHQAGHHVPCEEIIAARSYPLRAIDESNRLGRGEEVWPPRKYHSLIALAQHNGLPTRFLDFSYSPLVAAYFAASGALEQRKHQGYSGDMSVHAIAGLTDLQSYEIERNPISEIAYRSNGYCYQLVEAPTFFNDNLRAQKACFLAYLQFSPAKNQQCEVRSVEEYFERIEKQRGERLLGKFLSSRLYKITLGARHADELLRMLYREGTDASSVFPNIRGCVTSMFEGCEQV